MIFDTHSHYDDKAFDEDREELFRRFPEQGIGMIVTVGADIATSKAALEIAHTHENIYAAIGVHPTETGEMKESDIEWLRDRSSDKKVVAIGEIGLDYHWKEPAPSVQKVWFEKQIALAKEINLPIIFHSRDAAEDTMKMIQKTKAFECGGVIHCYSYSKEMAQEYVKMGYYIGVGGVVTFKNGRKLKETVEALPIEHIVLETDCPYLSPEPNRGKRNDSSNLFYVADEIARIKGMTTEEVIRVTEENARKLYGITEK
ncbi:MAG: TatD family hydrolase [Roseburia sp.]|nr:TatD family hydrolase [Roseburia sp.]